MSTNDPIDPYRKWLGIRHPQRPPNHYRLLGLEPFEDDPEVIQNAADQRMAHVRTYSTGKHSELSQQILNEIAAAKVCLLNEQKREQYNQQLGDAGEASGLNLATPSGLSAVPPPPPSGSMPPQAVPVQPLEYQQEVEESDDEIPDFSRPSRSGFDASSLNALVDGPAIQSGQSQFPMEGSSISESASGMSISRARKKNDPTVAIVISVGLAAVVLIGLIVMAASGGGSNTPKPRAEETPPPLRLPPRREPPERRPQRSNPLRDADEKFTISWPTDAELPAETEASDAQLHRFEHEHGVIAVGWVPDQDLAVSIDWKGNVATWKLDGGEQVAEFSTADQEISVAAVSQTGTYVLIGKESGDLELWGLESKTLERTFKGHAEQVVAAVFLSDGERFISSGLDKTLRMWTVENSTEVKQWEVRHSALALAVSQQQPFLVAGHRGFISLLNFNDWERPRPIRLSKGEVVTSAAFLPRGFKFLTAGSDQTIRAWDWNADSPNRDFRGSKDSIWCLAVEPSGKYAVSGAGASYNFNRRSWSSVYESTLRIWQWQRRQSLKPLEGHRSTVWTTQFHPRKPLLISGSFDGTARVWDLSKLERDAPSTDSPELVSAENTIQPSEELALGSQFAPAGLVPSFEFDPDALGISLEPIPTPSKGNSIPAVQLPDALVIEDAPVRQPAALLTEEELATYENSFAALVKEANRENANQLVQELLQEARNQTGSSGLARYLTLRAFGIAEEIPFRVEPAVAVEALRVFESFIQDVLPEQQLAVALAHLNMIEQMRLIHRRSGNKGAADGLNKKLLTTTIAAAKAYQDYALFDEARKLLTPKSFIDLIRDAKDPAISQAAERLKTSNQVLWEKQRRLLDLVEQWNKDGQTPELKSKLGRFCLAELGNIELAAKLLKDSPEEEYQQIAKTFNATDGDPTQLLVLAKLLKSYSDDSRDNSAGCLEIAADAIYAFLRVEGATETEEAKQLLSEIQPALVENPLALPQVIATTQTIGFDLEDSSPLAMRLIPAGSFKMAGEIDVTLTQSFYIGMTEITQSQWQAIMGTEPSQHSGDPMLPVEKVSWEDTQQFLSALNSRFAGRYSFRLPTEAEWEYACRAGSTANYSFGDRAAQLAEFAWFKANSGDQPHPVATKQPNRWGLYDMHGNVREWVQDWASAEPIAGPLVDPLGPQSGTSRLLCGGGYDDSADDLQCNQRFGFSSSDSFSNTGFRVVAILRHNAGAIAGHVPRSIELLSQSAR